MSEIVYKILPRAVWEEAAAAGVYHGSADDRRDGFIHLSRAHQLEGTLRKHFAEQTDLVAVSFAGEALGEALRFEVSRGGESFPHLYGPLPTALAIEVAPIEVPR